MTGLSVWRSVIGIINLTLKYIVEVHESMIKYVKNTQIDGDIIKL